jgi:hypothetical protein
MKVIERTKAGTAAGEEKAMRLDGPLDMALCTIIPEDGGVLSIQLPAADWEDGLQAIYSFTYDGKSGTGEAVLPAAMKVVPVFQNFESHCTDATDGQITEDCVLRFDSGRTIDIASDVIIQLSGEETGMLNTFLEQWNKR